jgi:hypothetical protein
VNTTQPENIFPVLRTQLTFNGTYHRDGLDKKNKNIILKEEAT